MPIFQFAPFQSLVQPAFWHALTELKIDMGKEIALGCNPTVGGDAFGDKPKVPKNAMLANGSFKNCNTIEDFKNTDKTALFNDLSSDIWKSITQDRSTAHLTRFLLITFADLKNATETAPVKDYDTFFANIPVHQPTNTGWPLRNVLANLLTLHPEPAQGVRILAWREGELPVPGASPSWKSRFGVVKQGAGVAPGGPLEKPAAVRWEKNIQDKLGPRVADLAPMMDPPRLVDQSVNLKLKLMRWRILPALDLEKVANTRCLLLGAGTLGCYVVCTLMGWGVRKITFVDSARVSFSNPVRQPLFEFEDCLNGGKPKAACAAERLKKIFPGVNATGHNLSIPMPGHPIPPASVEQTKRDVAALEALLDTHDVVFLLMDSRESRWLPTVLGAAKGKVVLNAALGFDTYLVMRHGARTPDSRGGRLGCYYCNDILVSEFSLDDRTLDQMCTVTQPGLASIAASTAVELLVSLLQHPEGYISSVILPPTSLTSRQHAHAPPGTESILGLVPHQLRGFLAQFRNVPIIGPAYAKCTGCSETTEFLPALTGLDKLYAEAQATLENDDFVDAEDDDF
ncbi:hypothetical protein BD413DRAFT_607654 [Trametes elegans]|nr:hypothetical protein BD413DRAFT_607654 [Trametes elegans]